MSTNSEGVRRYTRRLRARAIAYLGGKCIRCGFDDPRALQIDHVDGGGGAELEKIQSRGVQLRVLRGEPGYQLLCANCNWIKRWERREWYSRVNGMEGSAAV